MENVQSELREQKSLTATNDFFEKRPVQRSDSLRFGSAVHTLTLQPNVLIKNVFI